MKLFLEKVKPEVGDAVSFVFRPETPLSWQAGQYLHYTLPHPNPDSRKVERFFTIAAAPFENRVMITTRIVDAASTFKQALKALPVGGTIEATGPEGEFTVADPKQEMIFIAGGIGITPFRSILLDFDQRGEPLNVTLLYANSTENVVFRDELAALAARHPEFKIIYFIGADKIDEVAIRKTVADLQQPIFYVSGPEPMVQAFEVMLKGMGVAEEHLKRDYFPGYDWP